MRRLVLCVLTGVVLSAGCASDLVKTAERIEGLKAQVEELGEELADATEVFDRLKLDKATDAKEEEVLPFDWDAVKWVSGDQCVGAWAPTLTIDQVVIGGGHVTWREVGATRAQLGWRTTNRIDKDPNGCIGWVAEIDGKWYGAIGEWLPKGCLLQTYNVFKSYRGTDRHGNRDLKFAEPLREYEPESGQVFYVFVCGLNWGVANVQERSNLVEAVFP